MKVRVRRVSAEDVPVAITTEFIKLESFLKLANAVPSGGMAKNFIQNGEVLELGEALGDVNEEVVKRAQIRRTIEDHLARQFELSPRGEIIVDARGETSLPGIFAAGDVTTVPYKQIVIAVGEGAKASLSAFDHLIRTSAPE